MIKTPGDKAPLGLAQIKGRTVWSFVLVESNIFSSLVDNGNLCLVIIIGKTSFTRMHTQEIEKDLLWSLLTQENVSVSILQLIDLVSCASNLAGIASLEVN